MTDREKAKLYLNMKYGMEYGMKRAKGVTLKDAMLNYYDKGIAIKRAGTGKLIHSIDETISVTDAIADDWIPSVNVVDPNDVRYRKVKFIAECTSKIKYVHIINEKANHEAWIMLEDDKMTKILSNTEMAYKVKDTLCIEIQGKEAEKLEELVKLLKDLF